MAIAYASRASFRQGGACIAFRLFSEIPHSAASHPFTRMRFKAGYSDPSSTSSPSLVQAIRLVMKSA
ncbi:MAG: hypothetical protein ABSH45_15775 [Bryobacteraceae bacterium]